MKKVGILTFHFADNYGAVIQAYALCEAIGRIDGFKPILINYIPSYFTYDNRWTSTYEKNLFLEKREKFEGFLREHCLLSDKTNIVDENEYDIYCVGSDQVWNTSYYFKEYFLWNVPEDKCKISYATSVGIANDSPYLIKNPFSEYVSRFNHISVREIESVEFIENITQKKCDRVCDPTVLLSLTDYDQLMNDPEMPIDYIFLYWLGDDASVYAGIEYANRLARERKMMIIHSVYGERGKYIVNNGGMMFYSSPSDFLSYIKNASVVVTNSYHAALFAVRYKKELMVHFIESMRSRFDTLIEVFNLNVIGTDENNEVIKRLEYDHSDVSKVEIKERKRGLSYLMNSLCDETKKLNN